MEEGDLVSEVRGTVAKNGKVLVIRRIDVTYHLKLGEEHRAAATRVLEFHADFCPVARTLKDCVEIETELEFV
ncbi:MAG: hypothetical protein GY769_06440 [bacterium]|nr:hypothetical protein [bacterium]